MGDIENKIEGGNDFNWLLSDATPEESNFFKKYLEILKKELILDFKKQLLEGLLNSKQRDQRFNEELYKMYSNFLKKHRFFVSEGIKIIKDAEYLGVYFDVLSHWVSNVIAPCAGIYAVYNDEDYEIDEITSEYSDIENGLNGLSCFIESLEKGGYENIGNFIKSKFFQFVGKDKKLNINKLGCTNDFEIELTPFLALFGEIVQNYWKYGENGNLTIDLGGEGAKNWKLILENKVKKLDKGVYSTGKGQILIKKLVGKLNGKLKEIGLNDERTIYKFEAEFDKHLDYLNEEITTKIRMQIDEIMKKDEEFGKNIEYYYDHAVGTLINKDYLKEISYINDEKILNLEKEYKELITDLISMNIGDLKSKYIDIFKEHDLVLYK